MSLLQYAAAINFTITLDALANSALAGRRSASVDNSVNKFPFGKIFVQVRSGAAGVSTTGFVAVYLYGSADNGVTYETGGNTDAAYTTTGGDALLLGTFPVIANSTTYNRMWDLQERGIFVPDHFGILVINTSGAALATNVLNLAKFEGMFLA